MGGGADEMEVSCTCTRLGAGLGELSVQYAEFRMRHGNCGGYLPRMLDFLVILGYNILYYIADFQKEKFRYE